MLSLVVGLGNIGCEYEETRHNIGFEVVSRFARTLKVEFQPDTVEYRWAIKQQGERRLFLAWPKLLMNLSGPAIQTFLRRNKLCPADILVVVDDFNLPLGRLRFRKSGSDGGHNGLASIIETLGTEEFPRLRLGTGPLPDNIDCAGYVLRTFGKEELEPKEIMIATAVEAVQFTISHCLEMAMTQYNVDPA
ncbi:MAG: aminoacyl-tRNA hydrolase [candidate division Zixibacteria bacterium]|nr:aminoacyl-tRNA hydrolase [candidate division Zixibacteria bacterium]